MAMYGDTLATGRVSLKLPPRAPASPRAPRRRTTNPRFAPVAMPDLAYTADVAAATAHIYARVKDVIPAIEWPMHAPYIKAINDLKKVRNAVILAHNYQTPEIYHGVADFVGDSLQLAREAARTDAAVIVQAGVHFMAETSKLLNPGKTVLIPDSLAGCSLAASITAADVRLLRERFPGVPVVTYVNTSAEVKAESDITCTSANAVAVVESFGVDTVLLIPDEYLAMNVAAQTRVKILTWKGHCEVHERFTAAELLEYKAAHPGLQIIAHPECPPEVIAVADFAGSTKAMIDHVKTNRPPRVLLVTECSMAANIKAEVPEVDFIQPCNFCPHMRRITLARILDALVYMDGEVEIDPVVAERGRRAVERMIALKA